MQINCKLVSFALSKKKRGRLIVFSYGLRSFSKVLHCAFIIVCMAGDANQLNFFLRLLFSRRPRYYKSDTTVLRISPPWVAWPNTRSGAPVWFIQYCISQDMCYCIHLVVSRFDISLRLFVLVWLKVWMTAFLWSGLALLGLFAAVILQRHDCPFQVKHIEYENSGGAFVCSKPKSVKLMLTGVQRKTPLESCTRDV